MDTDEGVLDVKTLAIKTLSDAVDGSFLVSITQIYLLDVDGDACYNVKENDFRIKKGQSLRILFG